MLGRYALAAVLIAAASPALADSMCGDEPVPPAMPKPATMRQGSGADASANLHAAFLDIKQWQGALKTYRDCLNAEVAEDKRKAAHADPSKPDAITQLQNEIAANNKAFDASVDEEERLVNDFHAAQAAYCMRTDVDKSACPK